MNSSSAARAESSSSRFLISAWRAWIASTSRASSRPPRLKKKGKPPPKPLPPVLELLPKVMVLPAPLVPGVMVKPLPKRPPKFPEIGRLAGRVKVKARLSSA